MTVIVGQAQISIYDNQHLLWGQSKSFYNCTWLHFTSSVRLTDTDCDNSDLEQVPGWASQGGTFDTIWSLCGGRKLKSEK